MENTKTIHAKMAEIKKRLAETKIKKSGYNKFAGFKYHELPDFLNEINKLNNEIKVNESIHIDKAGDVCLLTLTNTENTDDYYTVSIPYSEAQMLASGGQPSKVDDIQRLGSTITYMRRYLYMTAYNIQENDVVDSLDQNAPRRGPEPVSKSVDSLLIDIRKCENIEKLKAIWNDNLNSQSDQEFQTALKNKKEELLKGTK